MHDQLTHDDLLPVSWRARQGDFVSLMTLYESNYIRLKRLVPDLRALHGQHLSDAQNDCTLSLHVAEHAAYTTTLNLTYLFDTGTGAVADPDLTVRVYHDAHLAETLLCAQSHRHPVLSRHHAQVPSQLKGRWRRNLILNKWLDYCLERGHHFAATKLKS